MKNVKYVIFAIVWMVAGAVLATTIQYPIRNTQRSEFAMTVPQLVNLRTAAANQLCDESEDELGLAPGDCTAGNVCVVSITYCDVMAQDLSPNAYASVTFGYPANAELIPK